MLTLRWHCVIDTCTFATSAWNLIPIVNMSMWKYLKFAITWRATVIGGGVVEPGLNHDSVERHGLSVLDVDCEGSCTIIDITMPSF